MLEDKTITITVRRATLLGGAVASPSSEKPSESPIELRAALAFRRRGVEMKLVLPGAAQQNGTSRCDPTLIKAIARGRSWFEELAAGRARSLRELAERDGITRRYVRRLVDLAFLSPDLVEVIHKTGNPSTSRRPVSPNSICRSTGPTSAACWRAEEPTERVCPGRGLGSCLCLSKGGLHQRLSEKRGQGEPARGRHVPFSGPFHARTPGESPAYSSAAAEATAETGLAGGAKGIRTPGPARENRNCAVAVTTR